MIDNIIAFVGSESEALGLAPSATEDMRFDGGLVLPGLNDSHIHMTMGSYNLTILSLEGTTAPAELQERVRVYAAETPERAWIKGYGLPYEPLMHLGRPEREILDEAISDRPVYLRAFDSHSSWCNTAALRLAGIERGADIPLPNEVVVETDTGLATGMLKERPADALITVHLGQPSLQQRDDMLRHAMRYLNRFGITLVQNMDGDLDRLEQY